MSKRSSKPKRTQKSPIDATGNSGLESTKDSQVTDELTAHAEPGDPSQDRAPVKLAPPSAAGGTSTTSAVSEDSPPSTNRGVTITIHWLSITFFTSPLKPMAHFLAKFLGYSIEDEMDWSIDFHPLKHGARGYEALYLGPIGTKLYAYPNSGKHCNIEIPGGVIDEIGLDKTLTYLRSLNNQEFEWRASRIDIAFDHEFFTPRDCYDAWLAGNVRTRARYESHDWRQNAYGDTFYAGSRKSDRFIRVYNRRGPTRVEMELKKDTATQIAMIISHSQSDDWTQQCLGYVRDFIDFVDIGENDTNISRAPLLPWWSQFIGETDRLKFPKKNGDEVNVISKLKAYIDRLIPTLYIARHGLGMNINDAVDKAESRLKDYHRVRLMRIKEANSNN